MPEIYVDNEVYARIQQLAIPFVDKVENDALRRHFGLNHNGAKQTPRTGGEGTELPRRDKKRSRGPKIHYGVLDKEQSLIQGQDLHLCDGQGRRVGNEKAQYAGNGRLRYVGRQYSLSALSEQLLAKHGHVLTRRRGPLYWCNEDGITVEKLWSSYLVRHPNFSYFKPEASHGLG